MVSSPPEVIFDSFSIVHQVFRYTQACLGYIFWLIDPAVVLVIKHNMLITVALGRCLISWQGSLFLIPLIYKFPLQLSFASTSDDTLEQIAEICCHCF